MGEFFPGTGGKNRRPDVADTLVLALQAGRTRTASKRVRVRKTRQGDAGEKLRASQTGPSPKSSAGREIRLETAGTSFPGVAAALCRKEPGRAISQQRETGRGIAFQRLIEH